jgi:hypothetical protein
MNTIWIIAVITPIIAASFVYLFKLFETADAMRKQIAECEIWSDKDFPRGMADIEGHYDWDMLVGGYYVALERVYRLIGKASLVALLMFILAVLTISSDDALAQVPLRGHVSALSLAQLVLLACTIVYFIWVTYLVREKSVVKGQVDFAVARCKQTTASTASAAAVAPVPTGTVDPPVSRAQKPKKAG